MEQKNDEPNKNSINKKYAAWGAVGVIVVLIILFIFIFLPIGGIGNPSSSDLKPVQKSSISVEEIYGGYYSVTISGSAKNTSNKKMDYVNIEFTIYDSAGNVVGTAIDNQLNLGAGETWVYSAICMVTTNRPVSYKTSDVTVICY